MNKKITLPASLSVKIKTICLMFGHELSAAEFKTLQGLVEVSESNNLFLSVATSSHIKEKFSLTESAFNTSVFRLNKKRLIIRNGKTINLSPMFNNIGQLENLVINFTLQVS